MKIEKHYLSEMTLDEFTNKHNLVITINEREESLDSPERYYAKIKHTESKEGNFLCGAYANGRTPKEAIANYATEISCKTLVVDAYEKTRKEIKVPRITSIF